MPEQETIIFKTLKNLNSQQSNNSKIKIVREMLITLSMYYKRFKNLYDENTNLQKHIHISCVNHLVNLSTSYLILFECPKNNFLKEKIVCKIDFLISLLYYT